MWVLIPVFWMLLALGSAGSVDEAIDGTQLREGSSRSVPMTGKPIKIPPKKV